MYAAKQMERCSSLGPACWTKQASATKLYILLSQNSQVQGVRLSKGREDECFGAPGAICARKQKAGAWMINVPCGLWAVEWLWYKNRLGFMLKGARLLQNQNCLGHVFTSAFCLALLMEVERCLPVILSPDSTSQGPRDYPSSKGVVCPIAKTLPLAKSRIKTLCVPTP